MNENELMLKNRIRIKLLELSIDIQKISAEICDISKFGEINFKDEKDIKKHLNIIYQVIDQTNGLKSKYVNSLLDVYQGR